ncbi:MAG: hypothetical protein ACKOUR_02075 [Planctomycetota bacterium]
MGNELRNLKEHGGATLQELQQYLATMKGKNTKEMLGSLAESGLVRATVQAFIGCLLIMALFTAGPFFMSGAMQAGTGATATGTPAASGKAAAPPGDSTLPNTAKSGSGDAEGNAEAASAAGKTATGKAGGKTGNDPAANLEKAARVLGIDETKSADPKSNPREKDIDSLLDKIK